MQFTNSYRHIPHFEFEAIHPEPVSAPRLLLWNDALAEQLGIDSERVLPDAERAAIFSGNTVPETSNPIALAYAGHQFGGLSPQLGDGRAHLLGELTDAEGIAWDVQLKGSGRTRYSRGGDGRCALKPAVREFLMSEALHFLGVPTARSLAVVATGDTVWREGEQPGAVVTRVARSHLRVGTFEFFAIRNNTPALKALADYTLTRHYPTLADTHPEGPLRYLALLEAILDRQLALIVHWLRIGFIHGVMNTDNTALSGHTIDFGPCAMMGTYDPATVYSSIDTQGRYAFGNQPQMAHWNVTRLAEALLPLLHEEVKEAVKLVEPIIHGFPEKFHTQFYAMMGEKLGITAITAEDHVLIQQLLTHMQTDGMDYTNTFMTLAQALETQDASTPLEQSLSTWLPQWYQRVQAQSDSTDAALARMRRVNPRVIPRNHHVESVLSACEAGDTAQVAAFLTVLRSPYTQLPETAEYQGLPEDGDRCYQTFCGT